MRRNAARLAAVLFAALPPTIAAAQEAREFCPDRPGLGTPACTMDRGRVAVELGFVDWTLDKQEGDRTDTVLAGDFLIRYGVTDTLEAQVGWKAFGHVRTRSGGVADTVEGTGDLLLAMRQNLHNPDGSGFAIAVMPFLTLPTGGTAIGAGDWGAGLLLPTSQELPNGFQLGVTGSVEAAVDADGDGRHFAYGAIVGVDVPVSEAVGVTVELSGQRDADPSGTESEWLGALSANWSPSDSLRFDAGANVGLNSNAPDLQLYIGVARRF